jgi:glycosyltransferase involved in cell wall biosynthesis
MRKTLKKNILMICYYYPPLTDVGSKRSVAFSKYFKKHGWDPFVLSVKNPDKIYCSLGSDAPPPGIPTEYSYSIVNPSKFFGKLNGLLLRLLKPFRIDLKRNYFYDIFCIPDFFWGWIPLTTLKGYNLIRKQDIDIIYVSCSPFSSAVIGVLLKVLTAKPLILDFRDPFALERLSFLGFPHFRKKINRRIEEYFLKHADIFVVTSEETRRGYIKQYPEVKDKIFTVYNGFDSKYLPQKPVQKYSKFTIVYTGAFYFYAPQSNKIFFKAISLLKASGKVNKETFQFLFYDDEKDRIEAIAKDYGIEDLVFASSRIPYKDVLDVISRSHFQLLRIIKLMISTKLYEGIALNIPFLATIPAGEVEGIIKKYSPSSYIITDESADKVAEAIADAMRKYENDEIRDNHVKEFLEEFSRESLTLKLMKIIREELDIAS